MALRTFPFENHAGVLWGNTGPIYMVSGTRDNPPPEATLSSVCMWKYSPCRLNKSWPCMIIHNSYCIIKSANIPLCLSFPQSFDHSGFCWINFLFDTIFSSIAVLNLKCRHYVTLAMPRVAPVRRAKVFMYTQRKVVGYFTCQDESTCPPELSRPQVWLVILV